MCACPQINLEIRILLAPLPSAEAMSLSACDGPLRGELVTTSVLKAKLPEIKRACSKLPFLLCGPPGCGKKSALRLVLGDPLAPHDLGGISNGNGTKLDSLEKLLRSNLQQQTIGGEGGLGSSQ